MDNSFGNTNNNSWRSSQRSNGLTKNSRFDSLHSDEYKTVRRQRNRNSSQSTNGETASTSKLFSVNNTSLADFIPDIPQPQQKYVSPAMRRQTQPNPHRPRNQFTSARKKKKPVLDLSGTSFPMIGPSGAGPSGAGPSGGTTDSNVNYKAAAAMNDDDYDTKKREEDKQLDDATEFNDADRLGSIVDDNNEEEIGFRDPVCPYEAGEAALYMIKSYQHKRDEQNVLLGAQSPYWNMKSLLDFTTDDEDSNYASSSESETENNGSDDDHY
tara:strand:+ start:3200 stop:4006 length:807 start_codon:yes stop_codon:yes gene_type:complete